MQEQHLPAVEVERILSEIATPIFCTDIKRLQMLLAEHSYEMFDFALLDLLLGDMVGDDATLLANVNILAREHIAVILAEWGVTLDEDGDLAAMTDILESLMECTNWDPIEDIQMLLESDYSPVELVIEIARTLRDPNNQYYATTVLGVRDTFKKRLREVIEFGFNEDDSPVNDPEQISEIRSYFKMAGRLTCYRLLHLGYAIGSPADSYFRRNSGLVSKFDNEAAAREILGFMLFSRDCWRDPIGSWDKVSEHFDIDLHEKSILGIAIKNVYGEFQKFKEVNNEYQ